MGNARTYKLVAITGGIGSGKSTVGKMLEKRGYTVIDSDIVARELTSAGSPLVKEIADEFGSEVLDQDGHLDRAKTASIVFNDPEKLRILEEILHPGIRAEYHSRAEASGDPWVFVQIPLLFEAGQADSVDMIWLCYAPADVRLERKSRGDESRKDEIRARMGNQMPDEYKLDKSDVVIDTDCSLEEVEEQVDRALEGMTG